MSKEQMERWLAYEHRLTNNQLRQEYEKAYKEELDCGVSNFLMAMWYTLHFSEEIQLKNDELASFMKDLFASVDMFRRGEYKPEDYEKELKEDGVEFAEYEYTRLYSDRIDKIDAFIGEKKKEVLEKEDISKEDIIRIIAEIEAVNKEVR